MIYEELKARLNRSLEIAREVGDFLISKQLDDFKTSSKGRSDLVTEMDIDSEKKIKAHLHSYFPHDNFLGEEMGYEKHGDGGTWVIDPIDGTSNYVQGLPGFTISIGYEIERWKPVLGVVYDPLLKEAFYGFQEGGAFLNGKPLTCGSKEKLTESIVFTSPPMRYNNYMEDFLSNYQKIIKEIGEFRDYGSAALHLAYVAAGRGDLFYEFGLQYHDMAGGSILVKEAGGAISPIYPTQQGQFNGSIIASGLNSHSAYCELLQIEWVNLDRL